MNEAPEPGGQECPAVRVAAQTLRPARTQLEPRQMLLLLSGLGDTGQPMSHSGVVRLAGRGPHLSGFPEAEPMSTSPRSPAADLKAARGTRPSQPPRHRPAWQFPGHAGSRGARGSRETQRPSRGPHLRGAPRDQKWGLFKAPMALVSHLLHESLTSLSSSRCLCDSSPRARTASQQSHHARGPGRGRDHASTAGSGHGSTRCWGRCLGLISK